MKYLFTLLLGFALAGNASAQMMQAITNDVHHSSGGGAVASLIHKISSPSCGAGITCSQTITAIPSGHSLVFITQALAINVTMASINTGGTLVPCGGGAANTGGNINSGAVASSFSCGWVLSTSASGTTMTVTYNTATTGGSSWTMYEFACAGGTVSHDVDLGAANGTDTTPFNGVTLTGLTGTNDFMLQGADGNNTDPTTISGPYGDFLTGSLGMGTGDLLNSTSGTAPSFTAAGNSGGKIASAVAMMCQ